MSDEFIFIQSESEYILGTCLRCLKHHHLIITEALRSKRTKRNINVKPVCRYNTHYHSPAHWNNNVGKIQISSTTLVTALFTSMRIVKFKSQLTIAFFAAVNHLNGPLRKQNFTLTGSKGHGLWFVIGGFRSVLCVSVFQGSLLVIVYDWRQRKTQLWGRLRNFRVRMFVKSAVNQANRGQNPTLFGVLICTP